METSAVEVEHMGELEKALDAQFPKGDAARGRALMLFAEAMSRIRKTIRAFGGCTICYGKGYSTQAEVGRGIMPCECDRGAQIRKLLDNAK